VQPYTPQFLCTQAQRTLPTRQFFYQQIEWIDAPLCIDIGCGTGVISKEITHLIMRSTVIGFDIDQNLVDYAVLDNRDNQALHLLLADVTALPFRSAIVDFALAHFTLMWIPNRKQALEEIYVILSPNGSLACVEPDYAGRIEILESRLGIKSKPPFPIVTALTRLGADPFTGGHLPEELAQLAFGEIQFGVLSWTFDAQAIRAEILSEADLLKGKGIDWMVPVFIYTPIFWVYGTKLP
jgi:SAM-dependent methyltransferase